MNAPVKALGLNLRVITPLDSPLAGCRDDVPGISNAGAEIEDMYEMKYCQRHLLDSMHFVSQA